METDLEKGGLNKAFLTLPWLAGRGQRTCLPSDKKYNERKRMTASLKVACWSICTMQDSEGRPQRRSALVGRELARLHIDIAAVNEIRFADQGPLRQDGAGCTLF